MTGTFCAREADVLALVAIEQWPRQAGADLVGHVGSCQACADALTVALALREQDGAEPPSLPDGRAVWQRAVWQARHEAVRRAARPVTAMQAIAGVVALATVAAVGVWLGWLASMAAWLGSVGADGRQAVSLVRETGTSVAQLFTFDIPVGVIWLAAGAVAAGVSAIGLAMALSALADRSEA